MMIMHQPHRFSPRTILQQRCSERGEGPIFEGAFRMNERCPVCGYKFERGPGYFTGAMYFSYGLEIPIIAAGVVLGKFLLVPTWPPTGSSWPSGSPPCRSSLRSSATRASSSSTWTAISIPKAREIEPAMNGPCIRPSRTDITHFPTLDQHVHGKPLVYLGNAASTQKPRPLIDAVVRFYEADNANVHRGPMP
jgi:hypothetical protein